MKIAVEGTIGVGKSTFCKELGNVLKNHVVIEEPVTDNPYLEDYYKSPEKHAFSLQIEMLSIRAKSIQDSLKIGPNIILDRSLPGDYVFASANFIVGYLQKREFQTYQRFYSIVKENVTTPDVYIYLHADPNIIWERIKKRARNEEIGLDKGYFHVLCNEYDRAMGLEKLLGSNVHIVDWTEFKSVSDVAKECGLL